MVRSFKTYFTYTTINGRAYQSKTHPASEMLALILSLVIVIFRVI